MGVLVGQVREVRSVRDGDIEPSPDLGGVDRHQVDFILGVGKAQTHVAFLLDIAKVLSSEDVVGV